MPLRSQLNKIDLDYFQIGRPSAFGFLISVSSPFSGLLILPWPSSSNLTLGLQADWPCGRKVIFLTVIPYPPSILLKQISYRQSSFSIKKICLMTLVCFSILRQSFSITSRKKGCSSMTRLIIITEVNRPSQMKQILTGNLEQRALKKNKWLFFYYMTSQMNVSFLLYKKSISANSPVVVLQNNSQIALSIFYLFLKWKTCSHYSASIAWNASIVYRDQKNTVMIMTQLKQSKISFAQNSYSDYFPLDVMFVIQYQYFSHIL